MRNPTGGIFGSRIIYFGIIFFCLAAGAQAKESTCKNCDRFELFGDFRLRLESDFASVRSDGTEREDRTRARVRLRAGLKLAFNESLSAVIRLRSGADPSQQSPHITVYDFDDNDTGSADFNLDRWALLARKERHWGWAGRNGFPFWKQAEFLWDDDVTLIGIAGGTSFATGPGSVQLTGGIFTLPVGMRATSGQMIGSQIAWQGMWEKIELKTSLGHYSIDASKSDEDRLQLLRDNGSRDYQLWHAAVQLKTTVGKRPLRVSADWYHNAKDYSGDSNDPLAQLNASETDGYNLTFRWGSLNNPGNWLFGYTYAHIEMFSVVGSYAQDDWIRWGSTTETRGSDFEGHEFRVARSFKKKMNIVARFYRADSLTSQEDGSRFRLDFNIKL